MSEQRAAAAEPRAECPRKLLLGVSLAALPERVLDDWSPVVAVYTFYARRMLREATATAFGPEVDKAMLRLEGLACELLEDPPGDVAADFSSGVAAVGAVARAADAVTHRHAATLRDLALEARAQMQERERAPPLTLPEVRTAASSAAGDSEDDGEDEYDSYTQGGDGDDDDASVAGESSPPKLLDWHDMIANVMAGW